MALEPLYRAQLLDLETRLKSNVPAEIIAAILEYPGLFEANRTRPYIISSALQKLADRFQSAIDNRQRWAILEAFASSQEYFPRDPQVLREIVKSLLVILSSNDPIARAAALIMLGLVAKKSGEDADIQFNVRVFWDTGQDLEKEAALFAAGILCRKSSKFASNVLSDLLSAAKDDRLNVWVRIKVMKALGGCTHTLNMARQALQVCLSIWESSGTDSIGTAALVTATRISSKYAPLVSNFVSNLLNILSSSTNDRISGIVVECLEFLARRRSTDFSLESIDSLWKLSLNTIFATDAIRDVLTKSLATVCRSSLVDYGEIADRYLSPFLESVSKKSDANSMLNRVKLLAAVFPGLEATIPTNEQTFLLDYVDATYRRFIEDFSERTFETTVRCELLLSLASMNNRGQPSKERRLVGPFAQELRKPSLQLKERAALVKCFQMSVGYWSTELCNAAVNLLADNDLKRSPEAIQSLLLCRLYAYRKVITDRSVKGQQLALPRSLLSRLGFWSSYKVALVLMGCGLYDYAIDALDKATQGINADISQSWMDVLHGLCKLEVDLAPSVTAFAEPRAALFKTLSTVSVKCLALPFGTKGSPLHSWIAFRAKDAALRARASLVARRADSSSRATQMLLQQALQDVTNALDTLKSSCYHVSKEDRKLLSTMESSYLSLTPHGDKLKEIYSWPRPPIPSFVLDTSGHPFSVEITTEPAWSSLSLLPDETLQHVALTLSISIQLLRPSKSVPLPCDILLSFSGTPDDDAIQVPIVGRNKIKGILFGHWNAVADLRARRVSVGVRNPRTRRVFKILNVKVV